MLLTTNKFGTLQSYLAEFAADFARRAKSFSRSESEAKLKGEGKDILIQATAFVTEYGTQNDWDEFGKYTIMSVDFFSAFTNAVLDVSGQGLLRDVLNKCLVQYSITGSDTSVSSWTVKKANEPTILILPTPSLHVQKVLELCPGIVQAVDKDKRLPLHYAAASANASFEVFMKIFEANKDAASIRDPATGLFPFQLAASNGNYAASFSLLLANPNIVSSAVDDDDAPDVSDRKRKRSS